MRLYTVSRELGHGSEEMVRRVYSHLGSVRHRSEVVKYRVEERFERIDDQLRRLALETPSDTMIVTTERAGQETQSPAHTAVEAGDEVPECAAVGGTNG